MEEKSTIHGLKTIWELFRTKNQELQDIINNLQINEVKEEKNFLNLQKSIKNQILLHPVLFNDPKIAKHRSEIRNMQPNYLNPFGGQRQITIVEVEFSFEGSRELFGYSPDSLTYSDPTVYLPIGNTVTVEVIVDRLEKEIVLTEASQKMGLTRSIITSINAQAESWTKSMEQQIEEKLQLKRQELVDFYG